MLFIDANREGKEITTTPTHPFWIPQKGWTDEIEFVPGTLRKKLLTEGIHL